jgi:hypothetical protein
MTYTNLAAERLREVLTYVMATGVWYWRIQTRGHRVGLIAGPRVAQGLFGWGSWRLARQDKGKWKGQAPRLLHPLWEDAVAARRAAEQKYYGEFAYNPGPPIDLDKLWIKSDAWYPLRMSAQGGKETLAF